MHTELIKQHTRRPVILDAPPFQPARQISPFELFRRLREGEDLPLFDLQPAGSPWSLAGARSLQAEAEPVDHPSPILVDEDGETALAAAERWQAEGLTGARALYGGLRLYRFCIDPRVVGQETFLRTGAS